MSIPILVISITFQEILYDYELTIDIAGHGSITLEHITFIHSAGADRAFNTVDDTYSHAIPDVYLSDGRTFSRDGSFSVVQSSHTPVYLDLATQYGDVIQLDADGDSIQTWGGNDVVYGHSGFDRVWGGTGQDKVFGQDGSDQIYGEFDDDILDGGDGADQIFGGQGDDWVIGGNGNDQLYGGIGQDIAEFNGQYADYNSHTIFITQVM